LPLPLAKVNKTMRRITLDLIEEIEKVTNGNWKVEQGNREFIRLRFKNEIMGFEHYVSGEKQIEPKIVFYEFYLNIKPKISAEKFREYRKEAKDNYENLKKKSLEQIKFKEGKSLYIFYPDNKKEWELYLRYLNAEKAYNDIPEFYYKNIGIKFMKYKSTTTKDKEQEKILKNAEEQEQVILSLLTKYNM
jgi:hypothetical protein